MKQKQEKVRGPFKCHHSFGTKESIWEYELDQNGRMINIKETLVNMNEKFTFVDFQNMMSRIFNTSNTVYTLDKIHRIGQDSNNVFLAIVDYTFEFTNDCGVIFGPIKVKNRLISFKVQKYGKAKILGDHQKD